jgi:uncharacterized membrane protein YeaQ/YmgE (transglycosylase-associated protein family)
MVGTTIAVALELAAFCCPGNIALLKTSKIYGGNEHMDVINSNLGLISWIIFGALAGWVAGIIAGGNTRLGCFGNIVVGVIGAFIGGWIYSLITGHALEVGWNWTAFIVAVLGAIILLAILNLFTGSSRRK